MSKSEVIEIRSHEDFGNLSSAEIKQLIVEKRERKVEEDKRYIRKPYSEDDYNEYLNRVIYDYYNGMKDRNNNWNQYECRDGCVFAQKVCDIALKRQINAEVKFPKDPYKAHCYIVLNFNW